MKINNRKRVEKLPENLNIDYGSDDVSDSEDEYSENERRLLEDVREKKTVEHSDSEDKVYGLENDEKMDDDGDSMASDIEGLPREDHDDLPDERAWGKKKRAFYSTDYVDQDYASASRKELADAEMEEKEARNIQKRLAEQLSDADFGLDLFQADREEGGQSGIDDEQFVKTDLSKLGKREKQALMQKESPEFEALVTDFKERMAEAKNILSPFLKLVEKGKCPDCPAVSFVKTKYHVILNYCVNVGFYLMLKAKRSPVNSHPVIKRLAQYRQLLGQLEDGQGRLINEIEEVVDADREGKPLYGVSDNNLINPKTVAKKKKTSLKSKIEIEEQDAIRETMEEDIAEEEPNDRGETSSDAEEEEKMDEEETFQGEEAKRRITYQMAKNKGLTPHRKKEQRNPRVKHRNKYRKAIIRRRGAVREVRKEIKRYDGEISGIKATVKKSIKIK